MHDEKTSAVFGLNWAQAQEAIEVPGKYDPDTELWTTTGNVLAGPLTGADDVISTRGTLTIGVGTETQNGLAPNGDADSGSGDLIPDGGNVPLS